MIRAWPCAEVVMTPAYHALWEMGMPEALPGGQEHVKLAARRQR